MDMAAKIKHQNDRQKRLPQTAESVKDKGGVLASLKCAWAALVRYRYLYLMLVPFLLWYLLFVVKPMFWLQIAFKDYNIFKGLSGSKWVGLEHFKTFFGSMYFSRVLKNTIMINLYGLAFGFTASIILALMLNEVKNKVFKKTVQTITYIPYFISIVVVAGIVTTMLAPEHGVVNILIKMFGGESIYFMTKKEYFRGIYTAMNMWTQTGFGTVVYMAALSSIDQELYEACVMDGGGKFKQLIHITIPGIMPTIMIMLIMKIGALLDVGYESIILLYQPVTYETADVINTYVYRLGIEEGKYGLSVAVGLFNSVVALALVVGANCLSKRTAQVSLW